MDEHGGITQWSHDPHDLAAAQEALTQQRSRALATTVPDGRVIFLVWAVAWLVGYGVLWATSAGGSLPPWWASTLFGGLIVGGIVTTLVHVARRSTGIAGPSRAVGRMYGWSWMVAFVAGMSIVGELGQAGVPDGTVLVTANGISALIVGILYMAGGALWQDRAQFALGVWMALVAAAGAASGLPGTYAVMAVAGGGGMLVGAAIEHVSRRRAHRAGRWACA